MIKLASQEFIPVTGDDWYQRRREDAEGEFFRKVADQGPRKGAGGGTRQGIYCFTACGKLLAYKNAQDADVMRKVVEKALANWKRLPADERAPGAVKVAEVGKPDKRWGDQPNVAVSNSVMPKGVEHYLDAETGDEGPVCRIQ